MCDGTAVDVVATASAVVVGVGGGQERLCVRRLWGLGPVLTQAWPVLSEESETIVGLCHALPEELRDGCLPHTWTRSFTDEELSGATLSPEERRSGWCDPRDPRTPHGETWSVYTSLAPARGCDGPRDVHTSDG